MIPLSVVNQGVSTTEVLIVGNQFHNLDLYDYFKDKMKREPTASENVLFITTSNTKITSTDASKAALTMRTWPNGTGEVTLNNSARITGAGGAGGIGAAFYRKDGTINRTLLPHNSTTGKINAKPGTAGGTAIDNKSSTRLTVINTGSIYGGGGGGGGSGAYATGFAINASKAANVEWLSLAPNGDPLGVNMSGKGAGGGGAPYGATAETTLTLQWFADTYPEIANVISKVMGKLISVEDSDRLIRESISFNRRNGKPIVRMPTTNPYYDNHYSATSREYPEYNSLPNFIYSKLGIHDNRVLVFQQNLSEGKRGLYKSYLPAYSTVYDEIYMDGKYNFYQSQATPNYSGSGAQSITGMPMFAQRVQQPGSELKGGVGGALTEAGLIDMASILSTPWRGWSKNSSTGKLKLTGDSTLGVRGGNGGDVGKDGEDGVLKRIYYRGGNSYRYFDLPHSTKMDLLQPAAGGKAGLLKTGNTVITNTRGGVSLGR